jgi:hypothetical protein
MFSHADTEDLIDEAGQEQSTWPHAMRYALDTVIKGMHQMIAPLRLDYLGEYGILYWPFSLLARLSYNSS